MPNNPLYIPNGLSGVNPLYQEPTDTYDRQVVVQLDFDSTISNNAKALNKYGNDKGIKSELVEVHSSSGRLKTFSRKDTARLAAAFSKLTRRSRVYLQAHGAWATQKLSDYNAKQIASLLADTGMPEVKCLSVLGCESARDLGTADNIRVGNSMDSFASELHRILKEKYKIKLELKARIYCVAIGNPNSGGGVADPTLRGHKGTFNQNDDWEGWGEGVGHKRSHSKFRFYWQNNTQKRDWAY